jgi:hypothetical protein
MTGVLFRTLFRRCNTPHIDTLSENHRILRGLARRLEKGSVATAYEKKGQIFIDISDDFHFLDRKTGNV